MAMNRQVWGSRVMYCCVWLCRIMYGRVELCSAYNV